MGRLHSNGKGISASAIPYSRTPPSWLKTTPEQVVDQICKLAKKGATPSQIGKLDLKEIISQEERLHLDRGRAQGFAVSYNLLDIMLE